MGVSLWLRRGPQSDLSSPKACQVAATCKGGRSLSSGHQPGFQPWPGLSCLGCAQVTMFCRDVPVAVAGLKLCPQLRVCPPILRVGVSLRVSGTARGFVSLQLRKLDSASPSLPAGPCPSPVPQRFLAGVGPDGSPACVSGTEKLLGLGDAYSSVGFERKAEHSQRGNWGGGSEAKRELEVELCVRTPGQNS